MRVSLVMLNVEMRVELVMLKKFFPFAHLPPTKPISLHPLPNQSKPIVPTLSLSLL